MEFLFVDRVEGEHIICENTVGEEIKLNVQDAHCGVKEGDVIYISDTGEVIVDKKLTEKRKIEILKLRGNLIKYCK